MNILFILLFCLISLSYSFYIEENMKLNNEYENYNNIEYIDEEQDVAENIVEKPQTQINIKNSDSYQEKPLNNAYIFQIMNQTLSSMNNNSGAFIETRTRENFDRRSNRNVNKNATSITWSDNIEESSSFITNNNIFYVIIALVAVLTALFVSLFVYILVK